MLLHSQYLPLMISPGRDWNSKYMISLLEPRTFPPYLTPFAIHPPLTSYTSHSYPPLHAPLTQSIPPRLHKPLFPSPLPHSTLSLTSHAIHPYPHLLYNPPLPSPHVLHNLPLPCLTPLSHWQSPHRQFPSPLHTSASDELSLGKQKFHSWCTFTVERLRNSLWS